MMKKILTQKVLLSAVAVVIVVLIVFVVNEVRVLHKAHSTFANYYSFRGCVQLVTKAPTYGICKTGSGQTIKIVLYQGKWYLNGDLPTGFLGL